MIERTSACSANGIVWNLSALYQGDGDPKLDSDLKELKDRSSTFAAFYRGTLKERSLDVHTLLSSIKEYESICELGMRPYLFALLYHSSNTQDHSRTRLLEKVREEREEVSQLLAFYKVHMLALPEHILKGLATHQHLSNYRHFLLHLIEMRPYTLTEGEETIIRKRELSGRYPFISLYDELMGSLSFPVEIEGGRKYLTTAWVLALLHSPDRSLRENAFQTFLEGLGSHGMVFKNILNALILNDHQEDIERGHPSPMQKMHFSNEMNDSLIQAMMRAVENHYPLTRRYLRLKARILGVKRLKLTDIFAPLKKERVELSFSRAKKILLNAMKDLHPLFHGIACEVFEKGLIDAEVRDGKQDGAFCKCFAPSQNPYISVHFTGNIKDLLTLAHELGHAIHYRLAAKQSYLNFYPAPVLAETASIFAELIVAHHLKGEEASRIDRSTLISSQIEGILLNVFRQNVLTRFELAVHSLRQHQVITEEEICQLWSQENLRLYGEEVTMIPAYRWGWAYIPHFFHRPFYCYSYIFGSLLSIVLFQNYQDKGSDFLEGIIALLSAGSSRRPLDMLEEMGLDPSQEGFWNQAFRYIGGLINSLEMSEKALEH
jgi:oligoendopeptidase F